MPDSIHRLDYAAHFRRRERRSRPLPTGGGSAQCSDGDNITEAPARAIQTFELAPPREHVGFSYIAVAVENLVRPLAR